MPRKRKPPQQPDPVSGEIIRASRALEENKFLRPTARQLMLEWADRNGQPDGIQFVGLEGLAVMELRVLDGLQVLLARTDYRGNVRAGRAAGSGVDLPAVQFRLQELFDVMGIGDRRASGLTEQQRAAVVALRGEQTPDERGGVGIGGLAGKVFTLRWTVDGKPQTVRGQLFTLLEVTTGTGQQYITAYRVTFGEVFIVGLTYGGLRYIHKRADLGQRLAGLVPNRSQLAVYRLATDLQLAANNPHKTVTRSLEDIMQVSGVQLLRQRKRTEAAEWARRGLDTLRQAGVIQGWQEAPLAGFKITLTPLLEARQQQDPQQQDPQTEEQEWLDRLAEWLNGQLTAIAVAEALPPPTQIETEYERLTDLFRQAQHDLLNPDLTLTTASPDERLALLRATGQAVADRLADRLADLRDFVDRTAEGFRAGFMAEPNYREVFGMLAVYERHTLLRAELTGWLAELTALATPQPEPPEA